MKALTSFCLFSCLCFGSTPAPKAPVTIDPPRSVTVTERSAPIKLFIAPFQVVLVSLPQDQKIMTNYLGNSSDWNVEASKVAPGPFVSIKIRNPPAPATTLNLISDHRKAFSFELVQSDDHSDSKVFLEMSSELTQEVQKEQPWITPDEATRLRKEKDAAVADLAAVQQSVRAEVDAFKAHYPATLEFPFAWNQRKGRDLGIKMIFIDGQGFTRILADPQEAPAMYEVKDGKPNFVDAPFRDGLYTITKIVRHGYLAVGKQKVDFDWAGK